MPGQDSAMHASTRLATQTVPREASAVKEEPVPMPAQNIDIPPRRRVNLVPREKVVPMEKKMPRRNIDIVAAPKKKTKRER